MGNKKQTDLIQMMDSFTCTPHFSKAKKQQSEMISSL